MMPDRIATVRTILICLLALAVVGFRAPVTDPSGVTQVSTVTNVHQGHSHVHHGHSHDDEDEPSSPSGHDHDRFHVGDHSHDAPTAAIWIGYRLATPGDSGRGTPDDRVASLGNPPGDRPPRA